MSRLDTHHPHWWKEIRASRRAFRGTSIVNEGYSNYQVQHVVLWQVGTFRLSTTQQEASRWWDVPPWFSGLHHYDFMLIANASNRKDFWVIRWEKTLALAWALQACAEESGAPAAILCDTAWELQRCMAPLMTFNGDDIVEASLLKPTGEEQGTSPTLKEKAALLGKEVKPPEVLGSLQEYQVIPRFVESAEQSTTPSASSSSPTSQCSHLLSRKDKKYWQRMEANPKNPGKWVCFYLQEHDRVPDGGENSNLSSTPQTNTYVMSRSKG